MAITLEFEKLGLVNYPLTPTAINEASTNIIGLPVSDGQYIRTINFTNPTSTITLEGIPEASVATLANTIDANITALADGTKPGIDFTLSGYGYSIIALNRGGRVSINGKWVYPNLQIVSVAASDIKAEL